MPSCGGAPPHFSRFGLIAKMKDGKVKKRIILDCLASGLWKRTKRRFRMILPRLTDVVQDLLILLSRCLPHEDVELFVVDFCDAFWNVPLAPEERRWF